MVVCIPRSSRQDVKAQHSYSLLCRYILDRISACATHNIHGTYIVETYAGQSLVLPLGHLIPQVSSAWAQDSPQKKVKEGSSGSKVGLSAEINMIQFLRKDGVDALVVRCNTFLKSNTDKI